MSTPNTPVGYETQQRMQDLAERLLDIRGYL